MSTAIVSNESLPKQVSYKDAFVMPAKSRSKTGVKPDKKVMTPDGRIRSFEELGVSTKTVIAVTNLRIHLDVFYSYVPIVDFTPQEKRRGRKKRIVIETPVHRLPFGSVIMVQRRRDFRGTVLKSKSRKNNTYFLHSVTVVMALNDNKMVNIKVSANGKFQITGCKENAHYEQAIVALYHNLIQIQEYTGMESFYMVEDNTLIRTERTDLPVKATFNTVMQNMDFNIGFAIDRNKLDRFINTHTDFCSIFEGSLTTEVNIKIKALQTTDSELHQIQYHPSTQQLTRSMVPYQFYCDLLNEKERKKEITKVRYHTLLSFGSGSIIMSSRGPEMKRVFYEFVNILLENRKAFEDTSCFKL